MAQSEEGAHLVIHALASQADQSRPLNARNPLFAQRPGEPTEGLLVAHLRQLMRLP